MINLPAPISDYFAADAKNAEAVAQCFTDDAIVRDEGKTYVGREAIRAWKAEASEKYSYVSALQTITKESDRTIVTSRLTGNFPGSPVDLRFFFRLKGDKISGLEIMS